MNYKKILTIGLILIAMASTISVISASDDVAVTGAEFKDGLLKINEMEFKIPDGFNQVENETDTSNETGDDADDKGEDIDGTHVDEEKTCEFKNSNGNELKVQVGTLKDGKKIEEINPVNFEKKSIAGKDGFFKTDDDGVEFEFLDDGKLVKISATNEDVINQLLS